MASAEVKGAQEGMASRKLAFQNRLLRADRRDNGDRHERFRTRRRELYASVRGKGLPKEDREDEVYGILEREFGRECDPEPEAEPAGSSITSGSGAPEELTEAAGDVTRGDGEAKGKKGAGKAKSPREEFVELARRAAGRAAGPDKVVSWVLEHYLLPVEGIDVEAIPSPQAVTLLYWVRSGQGALSDFVTKLYARTIPSRTAIKGGGFEDDGREVFGVIDQLESAGEE